MLSILNTISYLSMLCIMCPLYTPDHYYTYYTLLYAHYTPFYKPTMSYIHPYLLYYVLVYTHTYYTMS